MKHAFWAIPLLTAGACSGGGASDYNDAAKVPEREAEAQAAIERSVAQNGAAATATTGVPVAAATPNAARDRAFPADYRGYWGVTADDCELANVAATGRINIDADTIRFFESRARVMSLKQLSPYAVAAELRFTGEGQTWTRRATFRLDGGGTALVRSEPANGPTPALTIRYERC